MGRGEIEGEKKKMRPGEKKKMRQGGKGGREGISQTQSLKIA